MDERRTVGCIDDLILEVDSDLSIFSFVEAANLFSWYKGEILSHSAAPYTILEISCADYDTAIKLSQLCECKVRINTEFHPDEWRLTDIWYYENGQFSKSVFTEGA